MAQSYAHWSRWVSTARQQPARPRLRDRAITTFLYTTGARTIGGDCELTPARIVVEEVDGVSEVRLRPEDISKPVKNVDYGMLMLEPGDGTVTKASLLARESLDPSVPRHRWVSFPLDFSFFLCESHEARTTNVNFQDNLLQTLMSLDLEQ